MNPQPQLPVLQSLLRPLPKSQSKTVLLAVQAIASLAQAASLAIAALLLLTTIGHALALRQPKIRLPSKSKGPRLSLLSVGRLFFLSFLQNQKLSTRFLIQNMPKPTLRSFEWIDTQTKKDAQK